MSLDGPIPINQCHLIGTLLGFQFNPIVNLTRIFGVPVTVWDAQCYTHVWRYIGHVLGVEYSHGMIDPLVSFDMSRAWMVRIYDYLINPGHSSELLCQHVLKAISHGPMNHPVCVGLFTKRKCAVSA